ncbi:MAG: capsular biosynthesis protein [Rhizobiaceae bacterium]|nr:capsular biosynthesis protein [Rhizobiaceae bacterium]
MPATPPARTNDAVAGTKRVFLFLQGPSSMLFQRIAENLERRGHRCLRVNLCTGDRMFWHRRGALNYRGRPEGWRSYLDALVTREGITEMILLGEERPHHREAIAIAKRRGLVVYTVEMGYLRPDWIRVEIDGSGHNSHLPADPALVLAAGSKLPPVDYSQHHTQTFLSDAAQDVLFNLSNVFLCMFYPHYKWHAIYHPIAEYAGWVVRFFSKGRRAAAAREFINRLTVERRPYFLMPLQLETDYQIRAYSPFNTQREAIELVIASMALNAAADTELVIKAHPLHNGLIDWTKEVDAIARRYNFQDRVFTVDGGNLQRLISHALGIVTINSTAGLQAVHAGRPVKVLGCAVFDMAGLTDQGPLDDFWRAPAKPVAALNEAFHRLIDAAVHVRGNFYSSGGVAAGAEAIARRIDERTVNQPGGYVDPPPRQRPVKLGRRPGDAEE